MSFRQSILRYPSKGLSSLFNRTSRIGVNQYQWTFLDNLAQRHTLGIAHSARSGHLVIYCDYRIVMIRFGILAPETFHFLIEQELCRLSITGNQEQGFAYDFQIDTESDTELNQQRKAKNKRENREGMLKLGALALIVIVFLGGITWLGYFRKMQSLPDHLRYAGIEALGKINEDGKVSFLAISKGVSARPLGEDQQRLASLGPFLDASAAIPVRYDLDRPRYFILDWPKIFMHTDSSRQESRVFTAIEKHLNQQLPERAGDGACAMRLAAKTGSWVGQLELLDAYALEDVALKEDMETKFQSPSYQQLKEEFCP